MYDNVHLILLVKSSLLAVKDKKRQALHLGFNESEASIVSVEERIYCISVWAQVKRLMLVLLLQQTNISFSLLNSKFE